MKFDVGKALAHQIVLVGGDEPVLRTRALQSLVEAAVGGEDFDMETFTGESSSPAQWLGSCGTAPFLGSRRVAVVRNMARSDAADELGKPKLPESSLLILVADSEAGDESRQQQLGTRTKRWEKAVQTAGGFVYKPIIASSAFVELIKQQVSEYELKIAPSAINMLRDMVGGSISAALEELEKVSLFVGSASTITEHDIAKVVFPSREWNVFRLIDAMFAGQRGEALRQLDTMVGNNPRPETVTYSQVMPMVSRHLRLVWQARLFIEHKASLTSPPESIKALLPAQMNLLAQKEYSQQAAMRAASKVDLPRLSRCFLLLADAESQLKGLEPSFQPREVLEQMVLEMSDIAAGVRP